LKNMSTKRKKRLMMLKNSDKLCSIYMEECNEKKHYNKNQR